DFSYAYFVSPLRYRTPDKQCGPGRYRGLTAFASLSMAVSGGHGGSKRNDDREQGIDEKGGAFLAQSGF
ncbi:hypothetical protein, partial [Thiolapillus sp.]